MILSILKGTLHYYYLERIILLAVIVLALQAVFPLHVVIIVINLIIVFTHQFT